VQVNGRAARASQRVRGGDRVRIDLPVRSASALEPEDLPLRIVHEDDHLVVVDKPAGLVVHPGAGVASGTLVHALLHRYPEMATVGGAARPGIVHRLDKDTSGLLVVARSARAYLALVEAIRARRVHRGYAALVWGEPRAAAGDVDAAIARDPRDRKRMAVVPGGRRAVTHWLVRERLPGADLVEASLETGRTHQIRVHMAHLHHPIVGDAVYGGRGKKLLSLREPERSLAGALLHELRRQALHAAELELTHPVTGKSLAFASPWPEDFARAIELLRAFSAPS